ncbi:MAG: IPT/TIG domain-containing protein [Patescibacteria group bacterium]|jgi:hypothetical protein
MSTRSTLYLKSAVIILISGFLVFGLSACKKNSGNQNSNSSTNSVKATPKSPGLVFSAEPNKGPVNGGTTVKFTGEGIQGNLKVLFGENEATDVVVKSDKEIECKTPAGKKGKVNVTLKAEAGTVTTLEQAFTYE